MFGKQNRNEQNEKKTKNIKSEIDNLKYLKNHI